MAEVTPDPIMGIAMGFMAAKHLFVASEIGLFTGLAQGPATLDELAATCDIPRRTAGISADAMVSVGLLERDGERYRNSEATAAFLAGQPGPDLRPMLRFWNRISYPGWLALEEAVRAGAGRAKFGQFSTEEQQIFSAGVEAFSANDGSGTGGQLRLFAASPAPRYWRRDRLVLARRPATAHGAARHSIRVARRLRGGASAARGRA